MIATGYSTRTTSMHIDAPSLARGAVAGALAAAVWAVQQPLDRRVFGVPYDDTELLGRLVARPPREDWRLPGNLIHLANGAVFGAAYAHLAPRLPVPRTLTGPLAGLIEHLASWPLVALSARLHPARSVLPALWGTPGAFAQATWRHLLFGVVLGETERRLNPAS